VNLMLQSLPECLPVPRMGGPESSPKQPTYCTESPAIFAMVPSETLCSTGKISVRNTAGSKVSGPWAAFYSAPSCFHFTSAATRFLAAYPATEPGPPLGVLPASPAPLRRSQRPASSAPPANIRRSNGVLSR
jgi:hypothetical protein